MKPGTFTQMYVQLVFAVKNRDAVLKEEFRNRVFEYMSGIVSTLKHKSIIINGTSNHVHILLGLNPSVSLSDTVHAVKRSSSLFINNERLCPCRFSWQEGYGALSYSHSQIDKVVRYIINQENYHRRTSFKDEYIKMLRVFEVKYEDSYLFEWFDELRY